jgi:hypothetical protein
MSILNALSLKAPRAWLIMRPVNPRLRTDLGSVACMDQPVRDELADAIKFMELFPPSDFP